MYNSVTQQDSLVAQKRRFNSRQVTIFGWPLHCIAVQDALKYMCRPTALMMKNIKQPQGCYFFHLDDGSLTEVRLYRALQNNYYCIWRP